MLINPTTVTLIESEHDNWKNRPTPLLPPSDIKEKLLFELRETFINCPLRNEITIVNYDGKNYLMEKQTVPDLSPQKWKEVTAICLSWKSTLYDFKDKSPENEYEANLIRHCDELLNKESRSLGIQRFQDMVESDSQLTHELRLGIAVLIVLGLRLIICEQKEFQWSTFNTLEDIDRELSPEEKSSAPIFIWKGQDDYWGLVNQGVFIPHQSEFQQHRVVVPPEVVLEIKQKEELPKEVEQKKKKTQSPPPVLPRIIREEIKKIDIVPEPLFSADIPDTESDSEEEEQEKNPVDCLFCERAGKNCSRELSGCERCRDRRIGCKYRKATMARRIRNNNKKEEKKKKKKKKEQDDLAVVASMACVSCSKAKVSCSMTLPTCSKCNRKGEECVYPVGKSAEKANMDLMLLALAVKEEEEEKEKKRPRIVLKHKGKKIECLRCKGNHYREHCPTKNGFIVVSDSEEEDPELKDPEPKDPEPSRKKRSRSQESKEKEEEEQPAEKKQQIIEQEPEEQEQESESEPEQHAEEPEESVVVAVEPILRTDNGELNRQLLDVFVTEEAMTEEQETVTVVADVAMEEEKAVEPVVVEPVVEPVATVVEEKQEEVVPDSDEVMEPADVEQKQEEPTEPEVIADAVFRPITPVLAAATGRYNDLPTTILVSAPQTPRTGAQQQPTSSPIPYDLSSTWDQISVAQQQDPFPDNRSLSEGFMFFSSQDRAETKDLSQEFQPMSDLPPEPAVVAEIREFKLDDVVLNFHVPGFLSPVAVFNWNQITSKLNLFLLRIPENSNRGMVFNRVVHALTTLSNASPNFEQQVAAFASAVMDDQLFAQTVAYIIRCV